MDQAKLDPGSALAVEMFLAFYQSGQLHRHAKLRSRVLEVLSPLFRDLKPKQAALVFRPDVLDSIAQFLVDVGTNVECPTEEKQLAIVLRISLAVARGALADLLALCLELPSHPPLALGNCVAMLSRAAVASIPQASSDPMVYSFGRGDSGRLGLGMHKGPAFQEPRLIQELMGSAIEQASTFSTHTLAVTAGGEVWGWGNGQHGRLGTNSTGNQLRPICIPALSKLVVSLVACGLSHSVVMTNQGAFYSFGSGLNGRLGHGDTRERMEPTLIRALEGVSSASVRLACGSSFTMLAVDGRLQTWGKNTVGQCGQGSFGEVLVPRVVEALRGETVVDLAGGWDHGVACTITGRVYTWGCGYEGNRPVLGNGSLARQHTPAAIAIPETFRACQVGAGYDHSFAVAATGEVFAWGSNVSGQLGTGNLQEALTPVRVPLLEGKRVVRVEGGMDHSMAVTETGEAYSWGNGQESALGHSQGSVCNVPTKLEFFSGKFVKRVSLGDKCSIVLTSAADSDEKSKCGWSVSDALRCFSEVLTHPPPVVAPGLVVVSVLAAIDTTTFGPPQSFLSSDKVAVHLTKANPEEPFSLQLVSRTLESLLRLLRLLVDDDESFCSAIQGGFVDVRGEEGDSYGSLIVPILLVMSLRILKAHVHQAILRGERTLLQPFAQVIYVLLADCMRLDRFPESVQQIILNDAAETVIVGLEVFYPTRDDCITLLNDVLGGRSPYPSGATPFEMSLSDAICTRLSESFFLEGIVGDDQIQHRLMELTATRGAGAVENSAIHRLLVRYQELLATHFPDKLVLYVREIFNRCVNVLQEESKAEALVSPSIVTGLLPSLLGILKNRTEGLTDLLPQMCDVLDIVSYLVEAGNEDVSLVWSSLGDLVGNVAGQMMLREPGNTDASIALVKRLATHKSSLALQQLATVLLAEAGDVRDRWAVLGAIFSAATGSQSPEILEVGLSILKFSSASALDGRSLFETHDGLRFVRVAFGIVTLRSLVMDSLTAVVTSESPRLSEYASVLEFSRECVETLAKERVAGMVSLPAVGDAYHPILRGPHMLDQQQALFSLRSGASQLECISISLWANIGSHAGILFRRGARKSPVCRFQGVGGGGSVEVHTLLSDGKVLTMGCSSPIPLRKWVSLVVTIQRRAINVWLDGKPIGTKKTHADVELALTEPVFYCGGDGLEGCLADVRVYDSQVLEEADVVALAKRGPWVHAQKEWEAVESIVNLAYLCWTKCVPTGPDSRAWLPLVASIFDEALQPTCRIAALHMLEGCVRQAESSGADEGLSATVWAEYGNSDSLRSRILRRLLVELKPVCCSLLTVDPQQSIVLHDEICRMLRRMLLENELFRVGFLEVMCEAAGPLQETEASPSGITALIAYGGCCVLAADGSEDEKASTMVLNELVDPFLMLLRPCIDRVILPKVAQPSEGPSPAATTLFWEHAILQVMRALVSMTANPGQSVEIIEDDILEGILDVASVQVCAASTPMDSVESFVASHNCRAWELHAPISLGLPALVATQEVQQLCCSLCGANRLSRGGYAIHVERQHVDASGVCAICASVPGYLVQEHGVLAMHIAIRHLADKGSVSSSDAQAASGGGGFGVDQEKVTQLMAMGFPVDHCEFALSANNQDVIAATHWLLNNFGSVEALVESKKQADDAKRKKEAEEKSGKQLDPYEKSVQDQLDAMARHGEFCGYVTALEARLEFAELPSNPLFGAGSKGSAAAAAAAWSSSPVVMLPDNGGPSDLALALRRLATLHARLAVLFLILRTDTHWSAATDWAKVLRVVNLASFRGNLFGKVMSINLRSLQERLVELSMRFTGLGLVIEEHLQQQLALAAESSVFDEIKWGIRSLDLSDFQSVSSEVLHLERASWYLSFFRTEFDFSRLLSSPNAAVKMLGLRYTSVLSQQQTNCLVFLKEFLYRQRSPGAPVEGSPLLGVLTRLLIDVTPLPATVPMSVPSLCFELRKCGSGLTISANGQSVLRVNDGRKRWHVAMVVQEFPLQGGVVSWEFVIDKSLSGRVGLGVCDWGMTELEGETNWLGCDHHGWGVIGDHLWHDGALLNRWMPVPRLPSAGPVRMFLDLGTRSMGWSVNGEFSGVWFHDMVADVRYSPAVCLIDAGDSVTVVADSVSFFGGTLQEIIQPVKQ